MEAEYENEKKIRELNVKLDKLIMYVKEKKKLEEEQDKLIKTNSSNNINNIIRTNQNKNVDNPPIKPKQAKTMV
jgi:hypothetical protein